MSQSMENVCLRRFDENYIRISLPCEARQFEAGELCEMVGGGPRPGPRPELRASDSFLAILDVHMHMFDFILC